MAATLSKASQKRFWKKWIASGAVKIDQQNHPEILPGEVWITNADIYSLPKIGWTSKRCGKIAYDCYGKEMNSKRWPGAFPVFARASELAAAGVVIKLRL